MSVRFILITIVLFISFKFYAQPLSGIYTIGGVNPNYSTLTSAVNALVTNGVSGPVTFNIRPGTYNEKIQLTAIAGSSTTNTITFQSETNNAADVLITDEHTTSSTLNYTIFLDGVDHVALKKLTIEARKNPTSFNPCRVIYIFNDANNIRLEENVFKSYILQFGDENNSLVTCGFGGTTAGTFRDNDSIYVIRNKFIGGYNGLTCIGQSKVFTTLRVIEENEFIDQFKGGINCTTGNEIFLFKNKISQTQQNTNFYGVNAIDLQGNVEINSNDVSLSNGRNGLNLNLISQSSGFNCFAVNNAVKLSNAGTLSQSAGINATQVKRILLAHNTIEVNCGGTATTSCISMLGGDTLTIRNNILVIRNGGFSFYGYGLPVITSSNNNHYSIACPNIANINNVLYPTLVNLQSALSIEVNSLVGNPYLSGPSNLIPSGQQVYNAGVPIANVTTDFFGTPRSTTSPCIGAYEGSFPIVNAAVTQTNFSTNDFCPMQSYPLTVRISNYGQSPLTSAQIHFNGNVINWTGNLAPFQESADISLGAWFVPRVFSQTLPPVYVTLPNGQADNLTTNDTLYIVITPRLIGNYYVGGATPDFNTITETSSRLTTNGVCGDVFINIANGTYNEQVTFQNIVGLSANARLTFQSTSLDSAGVICTFNINNVNSNFIWRFRNISYLTIQKLTFTPVVNNSYKRVVTFESGKFIQFKNNQLLNGGVAFFAGTLPTGNIQIKNNYATNAVDMSGITSTFGDNKIVVDGTPTNLIDSVEISQNTLLGNNTREMFINNTNNLVISQNQMSGNRSLVTIDLDTCSFIRIFKNKFAISSNHPLIDLTKCNNTVNNPGYIHTNFLLGTGGGHPGIRINSTSNFNFYFNTVKSPGFAIIFGTSNSGLICKNNIFHSNTGQSISFMNSTVIPSVTSGYNSLYSGNSNTIDVSSTSLSVTVFQQTYSNEIGSFYAIPSYVSSTDLHLLNSIPQDGVGVVIPGILDDIDGDPITNLPDIGADQHVLNYALFDYNIRLVSVLNPSPIICTGDNTLKIRVKNVSNDTVTSFTVKWFLFNTQMNQFVFTQTLFPNDSVDVPVGNYPFNGNTYYDLKFNVSMPNNVTDIYAVDNTLNSSYYFPGNFQIGTRKFEDCSTQTELFIPQFPCSSVVWSTGSTNSSITVNSPGTYTVTVQYLGGCSVTQSITIN